MATNEKEFSSIMTRTESSFMFGVFLVNMESALILNSEYKDFWKFGFWLVGIIAIIGSAILFKSKFKLKTNTEELHEDVS